ncbi:Calcium-transporting ATPase [Bertholletia excelsa]
MEKLLKDFNIPAKNPSEEAQRKWRSAVTIVRNRQRRFRMVADLAKRSQAREKILKTQVCFITCHSVWFLRKHDKGK